MGIWFLFILATTSSFLVIKDLAFEHRMYLSLASVTTLAAWCGHQGLQYARRRWLGSARHLWLAQAAGTTGVALALITLTVLRNWDYWSYQRIWLDVISSRPLNGRAYVNAAIDEYYHQPQPDVDAAMRFLERGLSLDPGLNEGHATLIVIYLQRQRFADAEPHIAHLQRSKTFKAVGLTMEAQSLRVRKEYAAAEERLKQALTVDPHAKGTNFEFARLMMDQNRFDVAEKFAAAGILDEPFNAYGHNMNGVIRLATNRSSEAASWFQRAVELEPGNATYRRNWEQARQAAARDQDPDGAPNN